MLGLYGVGDEGDGAGEAWATMGVEVSGEDIKGPLIIGRRS